MLTTMVHVRVDERTKRKAAKTLAGMGIAHTVQPVTNKDDHHGTLLSRLAATVHKEMLALSSQQDEPRRP